MFGPVNARGGVGVEGAAPEREKGFRREDDGMPIKHELHRAFKVDVGRRVDAASL